ncbi:MAG: YqgE/AlgH family protein [Saprospiraceae bacterium]|nr:YqgE/AlgH family protein [Saprospiraceae bacterium]
MITSNITSGSLLIAEPFMLDSPFKRSVILICEHRDDGTVGFILNKAIEMKIEELIADFPEFDAQVYYGGPVGTDTIHYIHNVGELLDNSNEVCRGVYWGGDFEKLKFLVNSKLIKPENIKFFVGYSGWSGGQLEEELNHGTWITDHMYANYAFKDDKDSLWSTVLNNKGDIYTVIAQMPESPSFN